MKTKIPTPAKLKKWAKQFNETEWELLCKNRDFLESVLVDLGEAAGIAEDILRKDIGRDKL